MKSQFKKADASGARYALVFGADELARGEVSVKPLRDAGAAGRARTRRRSRLGSRTAHA
jgi:histidyl-tRNA synthetase